MHRVTTKLGCLLALVCAAVAAREQPRITIDYPQSGSIFPPDIAAPAFVWRDPADGEREWHIEIRFTDGGPPLRITTPGEHPRIGEIDPRCAARTNRPPALTREQAAAWTWRPDDSTWQEIKRRSMERPASVSIAAAGGRPSFAEVGISTSQDPVGAPIFYRDVPLVPSELQKGVIKPIAPRLLPVISWRLKYVQERHSRVVMEQIHTCANCHSFSADGSTLGMDLDGPQNDKGLYAIVPVARHTSIRDDHVISWKTFRDQKTTDKRIGFMSQVSPDGRYVVTTTQVEYYVANFKDYRFLQVFYPTRGILAYYDRSGGRMRALPGADDPRFVQANPVWSPDGKYLLFVRAAARDPYPKDRRLAEYANDPNEVQVQYDICRMPFNGGRGGKAEALVGASANGMSNSFPKVSPDGRWVVFVKSRNGQLMRPDGQLYLMPAEGGEARRMRCNTPRMNSWHSFSPNGRWMVFASKARSPYTELFLTHIDAQGNDSPAILVEGTTAANRAANIPEFVNIGIDGLERIDAPAAEFYRLYDRAFDLTEKGRVEDALAEWTRALAMNPDDAKANTNLGVLLMRQGRLDEAAARFAMAIAADPKLTNARDNLGAVLLQLGRAEEAIEQLQRSLEINPDSAEARVNLGGALLVLGRYADTVVQLREALARDPDRAAVLGNLAWILATCPDPRMRNGKEAVALAERAASLTGRNDPVILDALGAAYAEAGRFAEAAGAATRALALTRNADRTTAEAISGRIALYGREKPFREAK
jgi:tetratricopeptide (TPR) repeat protein